MAIASGCGRQAPRIVGSVDNKEYYGKLCGCCICFCSLILTGCRATHRLPYPVLRIVYMGEYTSLQYSVWSCKTNIVDSDIPHSSFLHVLWFRRENQPDETRRRFSVYSIYVDDFSQAIRQCRHISKPSAFQHVSSRNFLLFSYLYSVHTPWIAR